jgi:hypothetical protein
MEGEEVELLVVVVVLLKMFYEKKRINRCKI